MRIAIAAALIAATTGMASADYFVVQNMQTRKCAVEETYLVSGNSMLLLNNKFIERSDAEAAMREVPSCN
ncbi:MAG TPA: hypothetical protein PL193_12365 [Xanthobacteraceae bacterium]|nr:hypothetical protein [Xanthobacteraceae bacterium]